MTAPIRVGIVGYGNLGRGAEASVSRQPDMELVGVFTRRDASEITARPTTRVRSLDTLNEAKDEIDVLILCGGSRSDLPHQTPELAAHFSLVDSFDTHAKIPEHFANVDAAATAAGTTAIISTGWDPGLFSLQRTIGEAVLPEGETHTFWGKGLSQGHSDALRRIEGIAGAVQYTIPSDEAIARVRAGNGAALTSRDKHTRECFIVLEDGADEARIREEIITMPDYFEPYDTTVHVITAEELERDHGGMPHGGFVVRSGTSASGLRQVMEFQLSLESNPEFTSSVLVAYARAATRMHADGQHGAKTVYDVAPGLLSPRSPEELRREML